MKTRRYFLPFTVMALAVMMVAACSKDKVVDPLAVNSAMLSSHAWQLQKLTVDNVDQTNLYSGMTLSFAPGTYTSAKGAPVWPASGSWELTGADAMNILRSDQLNVSIDQITDTQLILSLTWTKNTYGGGRASSISGKHIYTFTK